MVEITTIILSLLGTVRGGDDGSWRLGDSMFWPICLAKIGVFAILDEHRIQFLALGIPRPRVMVFET